MSGLGVRQRHLIDARMNGGKSSQDGIESRPKILYGYEPVSNPVKVHPSKISMSAKMATITFAALAAPSIIGALFLPIADCDETFNYWEPTHYLLYGSGLQTWEYSPKFALRSYLYVGLHASIAKIFIILSQMLGFILSKISLFYSLRITLALVTAYAHTVLLRSVAYAYDFAVAKICLIFLSISPGIVQASSSYLPQSFAMVFTSLSFAHWINTTSSYRNSIFFMGIAVLFSGWPFVALLALPIGLDFIKRYGYMKVFLCSIVCVLLCIVPAIIVDRYVYGKPVIAFLSIIIYNMSDVGANLYGVQPWHFLLTNLILNFNIVLIFFLIFLPSSLLTLLFTKRGIHASRLARRAIKHLWISLCFLLFFSTLAHKEERFIYPVYPLLCLGAAVSLRLFTIKLNRAFSLLFTLTAISVFVAASLSRLGALYVNYRAPMLVYAHVSSETSTVCVGKEWHRFPSSFFLEYNIRFIKSGFDGALPMPFDDAHKHTPGLNDRNMIDAAMLTNIDVCDFIIDIDLEHQVEPHYSLDSDWEVVASYDFLDAANSPILFRSFLLPSFFNRENKFRPYQLLKRQKKEEESDAIEPRES